MNSFDERSSATRDAWYICFVLLLTFAFNYLDRSIISILVDPIKREFGINDTTIGLLQGGAFAVFYVVFSLPLSRVADRGNRRNLLLTGVVLWCTATASCGLVHSVPELFLARIMVAIGEAVLMPCAVSMLSDSFLPQQRGRALGIFSMGPYLGGAAAAIGGGTLLHSFRSSSVNVPWFGMLSAWRAVFLVVGVLGFILVPLLLMVREPARFRDDGRRAEQPASVGQLYRELRRKRLAILTVIFGFSFIAMAGQTLQAWVPTLFIRAHAWNVKQAGVRLGLTALVLGPLGAISGGVLADRLGRRGWLNSKVILGGLAALISVFASLVLTLPGALVAMVGVASVYFLFGFTYGLSQASIADLMPNRMRAQTTSLYSLVNNLLAAGLGPLLVGVLNDHVFHDPMKIGESMRIVLPTAFLIAAGLLSWGRGAVRHAVADTRSGTVSVET